MTPQTSSILLSLLWEALSTFKDLRGAKDDIVSILLYDMFNTWSVFLK